MMKKMQGMSGQEKKWNKQSCARQIVENMSEESEAIGQYLSLLSSLEGYGYKKAAQLVREIISDEKNHLLILQGMLQEFDGNIPVSEDNVQQALQTIKKSISKEESEPSNSEDDDESDDMNEED